MNQRRRYGQNKYEPDDLDAVRGIAVGTVIMLIVIAILFFIGWWL